MSTVQRLDRHVQQHDGDEHDGDRPSAEGGDEQSEEGEREGGAGAGHRPSPVVQPAGALGGQRASEIG